MTFEDLNLTKLLLSALADLEYIYPTPIQKKVFPIIMSGKNVLGIAQTGTGKTFAFLLPILRQLNFSKQRDPRVLILAPTHELVIQIVDEVKKLAKYTSIRVAGVYGGTNINTQKQLIYDGLDIIVATPGRLLDLAYTGILGLKSIQKLVVDEVDEMLSLGFRVQIESLFEMLPPKRQNLMFSATLTPVVEAFIDESFMFLDKIEIAPHGTPLEKIIQKAYHVPNFNTKVNLLEILLHQNDDFSKVLIFVSTKKLADRLFEKLDAFMPNQVGVIHSNKAHNTRINSVNKFSNGEHKILIATDIMARGMDISDVSHVINFDLPENTGDYIHRIGRTGRADKIGVAISFINEVEQEYQYNIETMMKKPISMEELPEKLAISTIFGEDEIANPVIEKNYLKITSLTISKGAFHEKLEKNKKTNSGSASRHKATYKKSGKKIKR